MKKYSTEHWHRFTSTNLWIRTIQKYQHIITSKPVWLASYFVHCIQQQFDNFARKSYITMVSALRFDIQDIVWFREGLESSVLSVTVPWFLYRRTQHEAPSPEGALKMQDQKMQDLKMKDLVGMRQVFVIRYSEHLWRAYTVIRFLYELYYTKYTKQYILPYTHSHGAAPVSLNVHWLEHNNVSAF